jgi:hypothetical protein
LKKTAPGFLAEPMKPSLILPQFFCGNSSENGARPHFLSLGVILGSYTSSTAVKSLAFSGEGMNVKFTFHILSTDD